MPTTTTESVTLPATAATLYWMYVTAECHSAIIGAPVTILPEVGAVFTAFDGGATGRNLHLERDRLIVQSWRGNVWHDDDPDAVLVLAFEEGDGGATIHLTHANIPDHCAHRIDWDRAYWTPWRCYLEALATEVRAG